MAAFSQKMIVIDFEKCSNCRTCEIVCSLRKYGEENPLKSMVHVIRQWENIGVFIPMLCQQCYTPLCKEVCPVKAIEVSENGAIRVNDEVCIGCKLCFTICPFGGITIDPEEKKILICDLCDGEPACVEACYREAIQYMPPDIATVKKKQEAIKRMAELTMKLVTPQFKEFKAD